MLDLEGDPIKGPSNIPEEDSVESTIKPVYDKTFKDMQNYVYLNERDKNNKK